MPKDKSIPTLDISNELAAAVKALQPAFTKLKKHLKRLDNLQAFPIGAVADQLKQLKDLAKLMGDIVDPANELIRPASKNIEEYFINTLAIGEASGVQGKFARVQITEAPIPVPDDWDAIYAYILKTKDFAVLNRQLNREHIRALLEDKKQVPGVSMYRHKKVSVTKL